METYSESVEYNLSSEDDSDYNPEESDSEGENSYRREIHWGDFMGNLAGHEGPGQDRPFYRKKGLKKEDDPRSQKEIDDDEERMRLGQEELEMDILKERSLQEIGEGDMHRGQESYISTLKKIVDKIPDKKKDNEMEMIEMTEQEEEDHYVQEWKDIEENTQSWVGDEEGATNSIFAPRHGHKRELTDHGVMEEHRLRQELRTKDRQSMGQRFMRFLGKHHNYEVIPGNDDEIELSVMKQPTTTKRRIHQTPFERNRNYHNRPRITRDERARLINEHKTKYTNNPSATKIARAGAYHSMGLEFNQIFADIIHQFTGLGDQDWWQPHVKSVMKDGSSYKLKHEGAFVTNGNRQEAEEWVNMTRDGRMIWIESHRPNNGSKPYTTWKDEMQKQWEEREFEHVKQDSTGKRKVVPGLPEEGANHVPAPTYKTKLRRKKPKATTETKSTSDMSKLQTEIEPLYDNIDHGTHTKGHEEFPTRI